MDLKQFIDVAAGRAPADVVLRNGQLINVFTEEIYPASVAIAGERIAGIGDYEGREVIDLQGQYICPGFIDGHVHIESSMLSVPEFCKVVAARGTAAVITDPHEIANVMGMDGIRYMLRSSQGCPATVYVMLSSCVPASHLESAGAELLASDLAPLLNEPEVLGLAEMMNFPGVVAGDPQVLDKLKISGGRLIDGHAPGLSGQALQAYLAAGITSDHECTTQEEAREKLRSGMHIMIREGSQARNLETLLPLVTPATVGRFLFVTDDIDVEDLMDQGHIDHIVRRTIKAGIKPVTAIRMATLNAARYFGLKRLGAVAPGYCASLAILEDLETCRVARVYHGGRLVAEDGRCRPEALSDAGLPAVPQSMNVRALEDAQLVVRARGAGRQKVHIIGMIEDQLVTQRLVESLAVVDGAVMPDPARDIAKLVVIERHSASGRVGLGFIRGFGLHSGAIASTVAHDAHNIVIAGTNDRDIMLAARHLIDLGGGLCAAKDGKILADVPLPIAGLISAAPAGTAYDQLKALHRAAREQLGCGQHRPFMGLSFMSLSVIGSLKLSDRGLIDVDRFETIELVVGQG